MNKFTIFCTATFLTFLGYFSYKINIKIYFTLDNAHSVLYFACPPMYPKWGVTTILKSAVVDYLVTLLIHSPSKLLTKNRKRKKKIPHLTCLLRRVSRRILVIKQLHPRVRVVGGIIRIAGDVSTPPSVISRRVKPPQSVILVHSPLLPSSAR